MELDYVKLKPIKPALSGYIRESQILLHHSVIPGESTVHDIRVLMKKARALLKLSASQLDKVNLVRDMTSLREVGRLLSSQRASSVYRKILREFRKENPEIFSQLADNVILTALLQKPEQVTEPPADMKSAQEQIDDLLNRTGYRIRFQTMNMMDPQKLIKELEQTYIRVGDIYLSCRNSPKPAMLHRFRKKSKDFLFQLYIFRPLNPSVIKSLEKKLDSMTQNLGKYHDLVEIINVLGYNYKEGANPPALDELAVKIREAQDRYLSRVWSPAYQIFCPGQKLVNLLGFKLLVI